MTLPPFAHNLGRYRGVTDLYDKYRPCPPEALLDVLTQLAEISHPHLVVDLGSGTGLSTRVWTGRADQVIGIEPGQEMRGRAERVTLAAGLQNIRYVEAFSDGTGLPDGCADIVTCSQALHWMEPEATFAEVARILRPGGIFAAYDVDFPPTLRWEAADALKRFVYHCEYVGRAHEWNRKTRRWNKDEHLANMSASGRFRHVAEVLLHNKEMGNAERLVGYALSMGTVATLLQHVPSEEEVGLEAFRAESRRLLGDETIPWYFCYRVRIGIK